MALCFASVHPARRALVVRRFAGPALVLAPMEGVHDAAMRALMTELGGYTFAVTEFVRISQDVPRPPALWAHAPELRQGARTASGVPVDVQLLGSHPERMADAAALLARLGAEAIDLNFGCPAKTVNRHDGGASLLRDSRRIYAVVHAVRAAVPQHVAVSAKLRLGWEDPDDLDENAAAAIFAGADWLTVHGRTRAAGYRPPALYGQIGRVAARVRVPVVANGDLFTPEDLHRCRQETGLQHFMLGRGALADPLLAGRFARALGLPAPERESWPRLADWHGWLARYVALCALQPQPRRRLPGRLKQWGMMAARHGGPRWIDAVKRCDDIDAILAGVAAYMAAENAS